MTRSRSLFLSFKYINMYICSQNLISLSVCLSVCLSVNLFVCLEEYQLSMRVCTGMYVYVHIIHYNYILV